MLVMATTVQRQPGVDRKYLPAPAYDTAEGLNYLIIIYLLELAGEPNPERLVTSQLLYLLSYASLYQSVDCEPPPCEGL